MLFTHIHLLCYCVVFLNNQRRHPEVISLLTNTLLPQLRVQRLAGRASIFLTFAARSSQRDIIHFVSAKMKRAATHATFRAM